MDGMHHWVYMDVPHHWVYMDGPHHWVSMDGPHHWVYMDDPHHPWTERTIRYGRQHEEVVHGRMRSADHVTVAAEQATNWLKETCVLHQPSPHIARICSAVVGFCAASG